MFKNCIIYCGTPNIALLMLSLPTVRVCAGTPARLSSPTHQHHRHRATTSVRISTPPASASCLKAAATQALWRRLTVRSGLWVASPPLGRRGGAPGTHTAANAAAAGVAPLGGHRGSAGPPDGGDDAGHGDTKARWRQGRRAVRPHSSENPKSDAHAGWWPASALDAAPADGQPALAAAAESADAGRPDCARQQPSPPPRPHPRARALAPSRKVF